MTHPLSICLVLAFGNCFIINLLIPDSRGDAAGHGPGLRPLLDQLLRGRRLLRPLPRPVPAPVLAQLETGTHGLPRVVKIAEQRGIECLNQPCWEDRLPSFLSDYYYIWYSYTSPICDTLAAMLQSNFLYSCFTYGRLPNFLRLIQYISRCVNKKE